MPPLLLLVLFIIMEPLTLQFSQGSSKCLETFHILKDFSADAKRGKFEKSTALTFLNANNGYRVCWVVTQESWNLLKDDQRKYEFCKKINLII